MRTSNYSNDQLPTMVSYKNKPAPKRFPWVSIGLVLGLCCLVSLGGAAAYYFLYPRGEALPLVLIHAPQNGESLEAGQAATVRALANDPRKIVRVELWVDSQLLKAETSNVSGGITSFPLLTDWKPTSPGRHTITVRAFNADDARGSSTVSVDVVERIDRDNDGAADDTDLCPDQPGSDVSNGCPDRDLDSVPDATDTCPDTAGLPAAAGCPAAVEGDRDGDGTPDTTDVCPDVPGAAVTDGCTDSDGDLVADTVDLCATEAGAAEDGCSTPGDADGDGVLDGEDICPEEWGLPEHGGCPELPPADDVVAPGGGGTTDRDGDGAADDVDPCPGEAGLPENDFCPTPTEDPAPAGDTPLFDFTPLLARPFVAPAFVEFEALHFEVPMEYRRLWCYVKLGDGEMERYLFEPGDGLSWNIDEVLGGENSVHLTVAGGAPLDVFAECYGTTIMFGLTSNYLGSITLQHRPVEWDGHMIQAESTGGGPGGHSFTARYHLCSPDCEATELQPPVITNVVAGGDQIRLTWNWEGEPRTIDGHKVYLNGNFVSMEPGGTRGEVAWWTRDGYCVDRWEFYMTSYAGSNPRTPDLESAPGNTAVWDGGIPCQKMIRVTFETIDMHDPPADEGGHHAPGPLSGTFVVAAGAKLEKLGFDAVRCYRFPLPPFEDCFGLKLGQGQWGIQEFFDHINTLHEACRSNICHALGYHASSTDTLLMGVDLGEDLTIRGRIVDTDERDEDDLLFEEQVTIQTRDLDPNTSLTLPIEGDYMNLIVKVDLYPYDR